MSWIYLTGFSLDPGPKSVQVDSIAFSVFVVILVEFDKYRDKQAFGDFDDDDCDVLEV